MCAVIVLDLAEPWELMNQLRKWLKALQQWLFGKLEHLERGQYEKMKNQLINHWKLYEEPQLDDQG